MLEKLHLLLGRVLEVQAPPRDGQPRSVVDVGAAQGRVERPGDGEDAVADDLGLGASGCPSPEEHVVRVPGEVGRVGMRVASIRGARDDQPVDRLHAPAAIHQLGGQPVQQRGVARRLAVAAEVVHRRHDRPAEVPAPDVVDRHPRRERVGLVGDPAGEGQPTARAGRRIGRPGREPYRRCSSARGAASRRMMSTLRASASALSASARFAGAALRQACRASTSARTRLRDGQFALRGRPPTAAASVHSFDPFLPRSTSSSARSSRIPGDQAGLGNGRLGPRPLDRRRGPAQDARPRPGTRPRPCPSHRGERRSRCGSRPCDGRVRRPRGASRPA